MTEPVDRPDIIRHCTICGQGWPLTYEFWHAHQNNPQGFRSECVECIREKRRASRKRYRSAWDEWALNEPVIVQHFNGRMTGLLDGRCWKCGKTTHGVWHHNDQANKIFNVGQIYTGYQVSENNVALMRAEILKSEFMCRECHVLWHTEHGFRTGKFLSQMKLDNGVKREDTKPVPHPQMSLLNWSEADAP